MKHHMPPNDREFKAQFATCVFSPSEFTHRAHLRLAYVYLVEHDDDTACQFMRDSLLRFLNHNGVDISKFHETMTRAWILAVGFAYFLNGERPSVVQISALAFITLGLIVSNMGSFFPKGVSDNAEGSVLRRHDETLVHC
jgi:hypothetical protein